MTPDELRTLFLFEKLDDERLAFLASRGREVVHPAGAIVYHEGSPATCFFVLLSGTLAMSQRVRGGEVETIRTDYRGAYAGAFFAFASDRLPQVYANTTRAVTDCRFFEFPADVFGQAVRDWFPMAVHLLEGSAIQGRAAAQAVATRERLVALGTVTAGLTHELNNPATAVTRATATLRERIIGMRDELGALAAAELSAAQLGTLVDLSQEALADGRAVDLSPLETADREDALADWLASHDVAESWDLGPTLVASGLDVAWAERLAARIPAAQLQRALHWVAGTLEVRSLLDEVADASGRISTLIGAAKQYSQMDRAPLQSIDVHEGLESTLTMLGHKIGKSISVVRSFDRSLPSIPAYPGELNQVWTNLVDNAVDAMDGSGTLSVRTAPAGEYVLVEIGDTGAGVPADLSGRIFEPFFTTKPVGKGTGLGLDISWRIIVDRHGGDIRVESVPGDTRFQVLLPVRGRDAA